MRVYPIPAEEALLVPREAEERAMEARQRAIERKQAVDRERAEREKARERSKPDDIKADLDALRALDEREGDATARPEREAVDGPSRD